MRIVPIGGSVDLMCFATGTADHVTGTAGLTLAFTVSKAGGNFGAVAPTVTSKGSGWYSVAAGTSIWDTPGDVAWHGTVAGGSCDPLDWVDLCVPANMWPTLTGGTANVGTAVAVSGAVGTVTQPITVRAGTVDSAGTVTGGIGGNLVGNVQGSLQGTAPAVALKADQDVRNVSGTVPTVALQANQSIGTVTGGIGGNIVGNVQGNVLGTVGNAGAVASVTGNVGGNIVGNLQGTIPTVTLTAGQSIAVSGGTVQMMQAGTVTAGTVDAVIGSVPAVTLAANQDIRNVTNVTGTVPQVALTNAGIDALYTRQLTEAYAADGAAPTVAQSLMMIQQMLGDFSIAGTVLTVKKVDGSTTAGTFYLNDSGTPTSITRAS